jgi:hypothetical protein
MSHLYDDVCDLASRVLGLTSSVEAVKRWPDVAAELRAAIAWVKARKPGQRRNPEVDQAADWLRRSLWDCKSLSDEMRTEGEELVIELKRLVGASSPEWKPVEPKRQSSRPLIPGPPNSGQLFRP